MNKDNNQRFFMDESSLPYEENENPFKRTEEDDDFDEIMIQKYNLKWKSERKTLHQVTPRSNMLAKQVKKEILLTGATKIVCPMCGQIPELTVTPRGERTMVSCKCGFVYDCEINF